jgi:hypothetical protein
MSARLALCAVTSNTAAPPVVRALQVLDWTSVLGCARPAPSSAIMNFLKLMLTLFAVKANRTARFAVFWVSPRN